MQDELLVKYLLGEASATEQQQVETWVEADEGNKAYFNHFKLIWDTSKNIEVKSTVDEHAAWQRFQQRVATHQPQQTKVIDLSSSRRTWLRAAAILLTICGSMLAYYLINNGQGNQQMLALESGNKVVKQRLADGSVVTLNKGSKLSYPEEFKGDTRTVTLEGEAFFEVAPDKQHPFIIHANESDVTVVGTSFNVATSAQRTEVIVETGVVEVAKHEHSVKLMPDEKATVTNDSDEPLKEKSDDALHNYYRTQEFICNGTPLWRLTDVLSQAYGVQIVIANPQLRNLQLTTTFRNEPLDNILTVISETFDISIRKNGNTITLQ